MNIKSLKKSTLYLVQVATDEGRRNEYFIGEYIGRYKRGKIQIVKFRNTDNSVTWNYYFDNIRRCIEIEYCDIQSILNYTLQYYTHYRLKKKYNTTYVLNQWLLIRKPKTRPFTTSGIYKNDTKTN